MVISTLIPFFVIITIGIIVWTITPLLFTKGIEEPKYKVLKKYPKFEIREYEPIIIAYTDVSGDFNGSGNRGFRILANYIFGGNRKSEKIKMTAPVIQDNILDTSEKIAMTAPVIQEKKEYSYRVAFVMPSKFTIDTLPKPTDLRVMIKELKKEIKAVYTFKGWARENRVNNKIIDFKKSLKESNIEFSSIKLAQFDPPFTAPHMRRNELQASLINTKFED